MSIIFELHYPDGKSVVIDDNGYHEFENPEEYSSYKEDVQKNRPVLCDGCICHEIEKYNCPFGMHEGKCTSCSHYYKTPSNAKDWFGWYSMRLRNKFLYRYFKFIHKYKILSYRYLRKRFFLFPSFKTPYFTFFKRLVNEYEDACKAVRIGIIRNDEKNKTKFFDKFVCFVLGEHVNFEYAECTGRCEVNTVNGIFSRNVFFSTTPGKTYKVRHIEKYGYWDVLYENDKIENYELRIVGQLSEELFSKCFKIITHEK